MDNEKSSPDEEFNELSTLHPRIITSLLVVDKIIEHRYTIDKESVEHSGASFCLSKLSKDEEALYKASLQLLKLYINGEISFDERSESDATEKK